ncbi:MAG TPA: hypothetical protein VHP11_08755 [Tepidisphaeraceae bacterium]|nr:hypothetical protein [Tepidisphaeraceae bacterium]
MLIGTAVLVVLCLTLCSAQDPGWPRRHVKPGGTLIVYQPQIDDWKDFREVTWRQAFQFIPTGGREIVGAATFHGTTAVDTDTHMVAIYGITVTNTYFPALDPARHREMDKLVRSFVPPTVSISLERVAAYVPKSQPVKTVSLKNDPPFVFVSYGPAILLGVDGEPVLAAVPNTKLKYVINTQWPLFLDTAKSKYYLLVGQRWLTAGDLHGPWSVAPQLPKDMERLPGDAQWAGLRKVIPPPPPSGPIPKVFYSTMPAEVILFDGKPVYTRIPQTQLLYATKTDSPVFLYTPTNEYYYLAAGRWFRSKSLEGRWSCASFELPPDFARIPLSSPASAVLASVPGTEEAKDAVLIAQIPTVMQINPKSAAAQAKVNYAGAPQFAPIEGTSLSYATNTADKVIKVDDVYYLCLQGVWFTSSNAQGPWSTASSVPQAIYTIPPSSPVYNVTYVTQTATPSGYVESSYTAGYLGAFVTGAAVGAIVANGTGYYYPPYIGYPAYGYPVYYPYATPYGAYGYSNYYNTRTGAYGVSQTAYGPYGSATRAASYNPYTGTYKQGASVATPYGRQSAGQAYNPYTGTYAASRQGSSPTAQWGQSYVSNANRSAYTQHYSTAQGTAASVQGSQGGRAYGSSTAYGNTVAGKTSSGDMYAGHDGNVYKNTGTGWQKYSNGGWNNVNTQQAQQQAEQQRQSYQQQRSAAQPSPFEAQQRQQSSWNRSNLESEMRNRQRGAAQSRNFERSGWGGGGWGGGGRSWGGAGGGFGRRR